MPTIKRLSFIGLEYAFAPEKAYGMSRGGGFRRQSSLIEVETDQGVRGVGEAFGNPVVSREYFRMLEPMFVGQSIFDFDHVEARVRNAIYHLGVGNQLTACVAGINVALWDAIARGFGVRVCDLIGGWTICWPKRPAIPMPGPRSRSAAASVTTSSACAAAGKLWGRTSS